MNIIEELLQARERVRSLAFDGLTIPLFADDPGLNKIHDVLFRAANTIQTLEQQIKDSEATATRYAEAVAGRNRTSGLRYIPANLHTCNGWAVLDVERQQLVANCPSQDLAAEIAALLNKA